MKLSRGPVFATALISAAMVLFLGSEPAWATSQIFIQQSGSSPAGGGPNPIINAGDFNVGVAGAALLENPLLLIVGVYDGLGIPSITYSGGVSDNPSGTYGLSSDFATFYSTSSGDAYNQLGLISKGSGGSSESFVNWSGADTAYGLKAPTSFDLYVFSLDTSLAAGSPISVGESGASLGSFIIGYDCLSGTGSSGACGKGNVVATPFTNAGLTATPEPSTWIFVGTGLGILALGAVIRKRGIRTGSQRV